VSYLEGTTASSSLFERGDGSPYYSRSRYTALYITPRTAVRASNAKNIVIIDLHLLSSA
jgi:hypothetical protein